MAKITIPDGLIGKELYSFLVLNKRELVSQKKSATKNADGFISNIFIDRNGLITKAFTQEDPTAPIDRTCVINTTNLFDSHGDVHIPGIWDKCLKENKDQYLVQEHDFTFAGIITNDVKASAKTMSWQSLGYDVPGNTQALLFNTTIGSKRNPLMYEQYYNNWVKNHSVAMQYVQLDLAINDPDYKEEFATWQKYFDDIANGSDAEKQGFFWAVKEAKIIEGSAVIRGSNWVTPTLASTGKQPSYDTGNQPHKDFNVSEAIASLNFFNN